MDTKYKHKEAFCFMRYAPKEPNLYGPDPIFLSPRNIYTIWNSRDGVTPFNYPINGEECLHIDWAADRCDPDHKLRVGDMYWRDKTEDEAKTEAIRRMKSFEGTRYEVKETEERYSGLIKAITADCLRIPVLDIFK